MTHPYSIMTIATFITALVVMGAARYAAIIAMCVIGVMFDNPVVRLTTFLGVFYLLFGGKKTSKYDSSWAMVTEPSCSISAVTESVEAMESLEAVEPTN